VAALAALGRIPGLALHGIADPSRTAERVPTFAFTLAGYSPREVAAELGRRGIAVWDGDYYAYELIRALGLAESGGMVRVGFVHYNETAEIERLAEALSAMAKRAIMTARAPTTKQFFEAVRRGDEVVVDAVIGAHARLLRARNPTGLSPVLVAAYSGHTKLAGRIAAALTQTPDGLDMFDAAAIGNVNVVRTLLSSERASVDDRGPDGFTALHLAAFFGQLEVARLLLGRGADPNAVALNESRVTPLHSAVAAKHRDTASLLLALGASPNSVQRGGWTPLHAAARDGEEPLVDMLLLRGADATRKSDDGKTAIDLAEEGGHGALAKLLRGSSSKR
jgi:hypothetical protein